MSQGKRSARGQGPGPGQAGKTPHRPAIAPELAAEGRRQWMPAATEAQREQRRYSWHDPFAWLDYPERWARPTFP